MSFKVLGLKTWPTPLIGIVQLVPSDWDDYSFKTSFTVFYFKSQNERIDLGTVKIGYQGQPKGWTRENLPQQFPALSEGWFSLGQDVDYYKTIADKLDPFERKFLLEGLRDVVINEALLRVAQDENVFSNSLMRSVSLTVINGQFKRVLNGEVALSDFHFSYSQEGDEKHAAIALDFEVNSGAKPSTNVHVIIGRNGVGKTTLLNNMIDALVGVKRREQPPFGFYEGSNFGFKTGLSQDYFSSVVSISFSAFDPFLPPVDRPDRKSGPAYYYVGMKNARYGAKDPLVSPPKTDAELVNDFISSFRSCLSQPAKRDRWRSAVKRLESDVNFAEMDLTRLLELGDKEAIKGAGALAGRMSSGHSIVLLTITKLVDTVEEKTLILLDEPESHLHPPLLSAFTRALSDLLYNRNGVAIVATHSPVVLQEVPRSCVWKITRIRVEGRSDRPERETFGENVSILTREVFGLEVSKSGFHEMMEQAVNAGGTYESIVAEYKGQLGAEARAILIAMIAARNVAIDGNL
jgi:predicted ATPase